MNKQINNPRLEEIAEKYLKKVFGPNNRTQKGINIFLQELQTRTGHNLNYLHGHPLIVQWGVISNCNLRCKHCYYNGTESRYDSSKDLSTQEALDLIDIFEELNICNVRVTGGEIFLRKDIFEILRKLKSKNILLTLQTNATLINEEMAKKLGKILVPNFDTIQISLDGKCKETHELTRGKDTFDKTIKGINNLVKNNITVCLNCTATSFNILEIPDIYKLAQNLKVDTFVVSRFKVCDKNQEYLVPDFETKLQILDELLDIENEITHLELYAIKLYEFLNKNIGKKIMDEFVDEIKFDYTGKNIVCQKHDRLLVIGDGNVYLCDVTATDEFCLGNVKEKSLLEIWENRYKNIFFQEKIYDEFPCKNCKYFLLCKGGCPMEAYKEYQTINAPDRNCSRGSEIMKNWIKNKEM